MAGHQLIALLNLVGYMCSELYTQQKSDLTRRMMLEINLLVWPECMLMLNVSSFWRGKNLVWGLRLWRAERVRIRHSNWKTISTHYLLSCYSETTSFSFLLSVYFIRHAVYNGIMTAFFVQKEPLWEFRLCKLFKNFWLSIQLENWFYKLVKKA